MSFVKNFIPEVVFHRFCELFLKIRMFRDAKRSARSVFSDIYLNQRWGGVEGERFCSGSGSINQKVVVPYVHTIEAYSEREEFRGSRFVDLGCGDFRVGKELLPFCSSYVGVDVVREVVEHNNTIFGNSQCEFFCLDIAEDELPDGDVCFVRQVLQHLSNTQIATILLKLNKYRFVFITEHLPSEDCVMVINQDKPHGSGIRLSRGSGVFLTEPPFNISEKRLKTVLEIKLDQTADGVDQGRICTMMYKPF